jgi:hypothetical protein
MHAHLELCLNTYTCSCRRTQVQKYGKCAIYAYTHTHCTHHTHTHKVHRYVSMHTCRCSLRIHTRSHKHLSNMYKKYRVQAPLSTSFAQFRWLEVKRILPVANIKTSRAHVQRDPEDQILFLSCLCLPMLLQISLEVSHRLFLYRSIFDGFLHVGHFLLCRSCRDFLAST